MTNDSLRKRFKIDAKNSVTVSRIIKDTISAGLIRCHDDIKNFDVDLIWKEGTTRSALWYPENIEGIASGKNKNTKS